MRYRQRYVIYTMFEPPPPPTPTPPPQLAVDATPPTSGSLGVCSGPPGPGISRFHHCSAPPTSPQPRRRLLMSSMKWKQPHLPGNRVPGGRAWSHLLPARFGGVRWRVVPGPAGSGCLDLLRVTRLALRLRRLAAGHQPQDCTLHRANARAILRRSPWLCRAGWRSG